MGRRDIESIDPLSRLQRAFLVRALDAGGGDPGRLQMHVALHGSLDPEGFTEAWRWVVGRYAVLRSSVHWEGLDRSLQVAHRVVDAPVCFHDLRALAGGAREQAVAEYLARDRRRRLDLDRAPVLRITVLRLGQEDHLLIWTCHHILLDGWSAGNVLGDLLARYRRGAAFAHAQPAGVYRHYLQWLSRQDEAAARAFWTDELAGLPPLPGRETELSARPPGARTGHSLSAALTTRLRQAAGALHTTPSVQRHRGRR